MQSDYHRKMEQKMFDVTPYKYKVINKEITK